MIQDSQDHRDNHDLSIDPAEYARFIGQIELTGVWLKDAKIENLLGSESPERSEVHLDDYATWNEVPGGYTVFHTYSLNISDLESDVAILSVTFGVDYDSELTMTSELFEVFQAVNLPFNTWPYLREFIASILGRMNWYPFVLPALKRGVGDDDE